MTEIKLEGVVESVEPQYDVNGKSSAISIIRTNDSEYTVHYIRNTSPENDLLIRDLSLSLENAMKNEYKVRVTVKPFTDTDYMAVSFFSIIKEKYAEEKK